MPADVHRALVDGHWPDSEAVGHLGGVEVGDPDRAEQGEAAGVGRFCQLSGGFDSQLVMATGLCSPGETQLEALQQPTVGICALCGALALRGGLVDQHQVHIPASASVSVSQNVGKSQSNQSS
eukprot:COSAG01_NODE_37133_length_508_cov_0.662592_2_plen_122_part_01